MKGIKLSLTNILIFLLLLFALHWLSHRFTPFLYSIEPCILIVDLDYGIYCDENSDQEDIIKDKYFGKKGRCYKCDRHPGLIFHKYQEYRDYHCNPRNRIEGQPQGNIRQRPNKNNR